MKLCRRDLKTDILSACRQIRPKFYINESLTPARNTIMYALRKARKKFPAKISFCRSYDGNISAFLPTNLSDGPYRFRKVTINSRIKLEEFLSSELSSSLQDIGVEWKTD